MQRLTALAALLVVTLALVPSASARLAMEPIRDIIRAASPQLSACTASCAACPAGDYRLVILFTIESTGAVSAAEIERSTVPDSSVAECFRNVVSGLVFPIVAGGRVGSVRVNYPWVVHID